MAHKTDFKDALFEQRKYRMQNNPDGTVTPFDETEYTQVGDRVGAKEFNEIGAALNSLEGKMGERNLQTYTALSQLSLEAPVTMAQVFEAMPNNSYAVIDANGSNTITDAPVSGSGIVEISKINGGRNFARFTKSLSSQTVGMTMWYGTFSWADTTVFSGWKRLLEEDDVLETMEEIEANTDAGKAAGALAVKELSSELDIISSSSSTEHIVGKWIDGKPIYAKTISANINASGNRSIAHNVNGIGTFRAVDYSRSFLVRADGEYCPLPLSTAVDGQEYYASFVSFINETSVVVQVGTRTFGDYTITINYTKN